MNKKAVKKYRKKPIVIEAYQTDKVMYIETLEGIHKADIGDYIITGVKGEQYPCKPDIFEQTYEPMEDLKGSKSTPLNWSKSTSLGGWISVKDRLPEEYKEVLAYDINRQKEKIKEFDKKIVIQQGMIDYQKAEIERMEKELTEYKLRLKMSECTVDEIKSEAIKDFAKRLKSKLNDLEFRTKTHRKTVPTKFCDDNANWVMHECVPEEIDNLVKEMTEVEEVE